MNGKSGRFSYYVCGTLLKKGASLCPAHYLNAGRFEHLVVDKIKKHILTGDGLTQLAQLVNQEMDSASRSQRDELNAVIEEMSNNRSFSGSFQAGTNIFSPL